MSGDSFCKIGEWRELTNKEFDEIVAMMKAEVAAMSDEEKERYCMKNRKIIANGIFEK